MATNYSFDIDINGNIEVPDIYLCKSRDLSFLSTIGMVSDFNIVTNLNAVNEISFTVYKESDNKTNPVYDQIKDLKIVFVPRFGYFEISVNEEEDENGVFTKKVTGQSLETELGQIRIYISINTFEDYELDDGDYGVIEDIEATKFYNPLNPEYSLLHKLLKYAPAWSVEHVDSVLWSKERVFDWSSGTTIYDAMNEIADELDCIFLFHPTKRAFSVYCLKHTCNICGSSKNVISKDGKLYCSACDSYNIQKGYGENTNVFIDDVNLLKSLGLEAKSDEYKNCFHVEGGDDTIDISSVNPNGSKYIYMFSEQDKKDMPEELVNLLDQYDELYDSYTDEYSSIIENIYNIIEEINTLKTNTAPHDSSLDATDYVNFNISYLKERLSAYQETLDEYMSLGYGNTSSDFYSSLYLPLYNSIQVITNEIAYKEARVAEQEALLADAKTRRNEIQQLLDIETFLGTDNWKTLTTYLRYDEYKNDNFISTDYTSNSEIIELCKELLEKATIELTEASTLKYSLTAKLSNLLALDDFKSLHSSFALGNYIHIMVNDKVSTLRLISISFDFENPDDIEVEFSDAINDGSLTSDYQTILNQVSSISNSYSGILKQVSNSKDVIDSFNNIKSNGLNAALTEIVNADNQEVVFDRHGLLVRSYDKDSDTYDDSQIKIIKSMIAYTDDNWKSSRMAIGKVNLDGQNLYGVIADALVGNLIVGQNCLLTGDGAGLDISTNKTITNLDATISDLSVQFKLDIDGLDSKFTETLKNYSTITQMESSINQTATAITALVTSETTRAQEVESTLSSQITITADAITSEVKRATEAEGTLSSSITQNANSIALKVSSDSVISAINMSPETIKINANKVAISGYVTFSDLAGTGTTTINGSNITTGTISADRIDVTNLEVSRLSSTGTGDGHYSIDRNMTVQSHGGRVYAFTGTDWNSATYKTALVDAGLYGHVVVIDTIRNNHNSNVVIDCPAQINGTVTFKYAPNVNGTYFSMQGHSHTEFMSSSATTASITASTSSGAIVFDNASAVGWTYAHNHFEEKSSSDKRLKYDISSLDENICDFYLALKPSFYRFRDGADDYKIDSGLIAQDVIESFDSLGMNWEDYALVQQQNNFREGQEELVNGETHYKVKYENLHAYHIFMIQKAQKEINELQKQINELKEKIG